MPMSDNMRNTFPGDPVPRDASLTDPLDIIEAAHGAAPDAGSFRTILDALPAAIYMTDAAGRITYYNKAAVDLTGRRPEIGKDEWCVTWRLYNSDGTPLPHDRSPMAVAIKENRAIRGVEAILERPDGTCVPFVPYPTPLRDASGALVGAVNMLVDISNCRASESVRAYLAAIVESSDDAIVGKDLDGIITSWNRGAETIFGYRAEEVTGRPISIIFPPDRLTEEDMILERLRRGERVDHFETVRRRKDGHDIHVSVTISPVRDGTGRIIGASKIARDIGERKRSETMLRDMAENLERTVADRTRELAEANERLMAEMAERDRSEAALLQAQKMEAVGQLAAGVAHDFNNLLSAILGNLDLLQMHLDDARLLKLSKAATLAVLRGARLTEQLLVFSRKQSHAPKVIDLAQMIVGLEELLHRTLGGTVEVKTAIAADLWPALVDPHHFELAILNLAINARDAMPSGGKLLLEARNRKADEIEKLTDLAHGDYVVTSISDTGTGMTPAVLRRACEPFYTTKEPGKGSGLGLAQVYGMAQQSGGGMRISSDVGNGTTVELYLPRSLEPPTKTRGHRDDSRRRPAVSAKALVVDDHDEVREVIAAQLGALGYKVVQASGAQAALDLLTDDSSVPDLLIVDYAMPWMRGTELARAVRAKFPNLPVIIVTGYVDAAGLNGAIGDAILLQKPFRMNELGDAVELTLRRCPQRPRIVPKRRAARL
jgi:PAS domain S-box-containing protein